MFDFYYQGEIPHLTSKIHYTTATIIYGHTQIAAALVILSGHHKTQQPIIKFINLHF